MVDAAAAPRRLPPCDLVIDAAYGTGFRGTWEPPDPGRAPVLAVDIPSGVDGRTGEVEGDVLAAERTVTFAALKPGLLLGRGPELAGEVVVADIGLDVSGATTAVVEDDDVAGWLPARPREAHKWQAAVWVVAGSPGMTGAAALATRWRATGAARATSGSARRGAVGEGAPLEAVGTPFRRKGWATEVLEGVERFAAVVVGPGLGRERGHRRRGAPAGGRVPRARRGRRRRAGRPRGRRRGVVQRTTVLTPHDGEFARLTGGPPGADRIAAAVGLAAGRRRRAPQGVRPRRWRRPTPACSSSTAGRRPPGHRRHRRRAVGGHRRPAGLRRRPGQRGGGRGPPPRPGRPAGSDPRPCGR